MEEHSQRFGIGGATEEARRSMMPLFHFNSRTGDTLLLDDEGEDLPSRDAARSVAMSSAREALLEAVKTGDVPPDDIQVTDSRCKIVMTIALDDLIKRG
jgi:hypothetical protein